MKYEVIVTEELVIVKTNEYNARWSDRAKRMNGKYDSGAELWSFSRFREGQIRQNLEQLFGESEDANETRVSLTIETREGDTEVSHSGIKAFGQVLVTGTWARGVRFAPNVIPMGGLGSRVSVKGSNKDYRVVVAPGTILLIKNVPESRRLINDNPRWGLMSWQEPLEKSELNELLSLKERLESQLAAVNEQIATLTSKEETTDAQEST